MRSKTFVSPSKTFVSQPKKNEHFSPLHHEEFDPLLRAARLLVSFLGRMDEEQRPLPVKMLISAVKN
jgi:hypothetical protein